MSHPRDSFQEMVQTTGQMQDFFAKQSPRLWKKAPETASRPVAGLAVSLGPGPRPVVGLAASLGPARAPWPD
ncbi:hypothetical protein [Desulfolutivibrio sp.]|uniref:hypothetical protein n=1 Tax=Desulfolutivibrio sp. TaxID=2773296 RepID=UPI002F966215